MAVDKAKAQEYFEVGAELGKNQRWAEAIAALNEAVKIDPEHAKAHMALVLSYGGSMDLVSARRHLEILKKLDPAMARQIEESPAGMLIAGTGGIFTF